MILIFFHPWTLYRWSETNEKKKKNQPLSVLRISYIYEHIMYSQFNNKKNRIYSRSYSSIRWLNNITIVLWNSQHDRIRFDRFKRERGGIEIKKFNLIKNFKKEGNIIGICCIFNSYYYSFQFLFLIINFAKGLLFLVSSL